MTANQADGKLRECSTCKVAKDAKLDFYHSDKYADRRCKACCRERTRSGNRTKRMRFRNAVSIAKRINREFAVSEARYAELRAMDCHYCGGPLPETGIGLDRVVPELGYVEANVVPSCADCNRTKGDVFDLEQMLLIGKAIAAARKMPGKVNRKSGRGRGRPRIVE